MRKTLTFSFDEGLKVRDRERKERSERRAKGFSLHAGPYEFSGTKKCVECRRQFKTYEARRSQTLCDPCLFAADRRKGD